MPYDVVAANRAATQTGLALGAQMFSNSVRQQQLQSELAMQKLQQQQAAEMLSWTMRQHHEAIDKQADDAKRSALFQSMITPTLSMPNQLPSTEGMSPMIGPGGEDASSMLDANGQRMGTGPSIPGGMETVQVPNPAYIADWGEAYVKAMAGSKYEPFAKTVTTAGALSLHQQQAAKAKADAANELLATGPGSIQQVTGDFEGAPKLNVFVPPKGRGGVQLVGANGLQTMTGEDGRTYELQPNGSWKPLAATPAQQGAERTKRAIVAKALGVDPEQVSVDGVVTPEGWSTIQAKTQVLPATRGAVEKQVVSGAQALAAADKSLQTILEHPEAVGLLGAGRGALERAKGQLGMQTDTTIAKARQQLELSFTQLADSLRVDSGNMSRYELSRLERVGDPSRWQESDKTAADMMRNIKNTIIGQQLRRFKTLGTKPDNAFLKQIPESEVIPLGQDNLLTEEEAAQWWKLRYGK